MQIKGKQESTSFAQLVLGPVFLLNGVIFFFQALTKNLYPPMLVPLREAFLIDNAQAGLLVTLVFFGYALARYPSGVIADQIGCTRTILIGSCAMVISFIGVAFSPSYPLLALMTFILGVSSGIYVTAGYTLAVIIGSRKRATAATGAFETFGILSSVMSPIIVTLFVIYSSWQLLFALCGLLLILATFFFYRKREIAECFESDYAALNGFNDEKGRVVSAGAGTESGAGGFLSKIRASTAVFKEPVIRRFLIWSTLVGGFGALSLTGISSFIPTFLVEERSYSFDVANRMYIIIPLAGLLTKIVIGWLADRFGSKRVMFINLTLLTLFFLALTLARGHWQLIIILALIGAAALNANTLINAYVLRSMPPRYQGTGFGLFSTAYTVIYSFGPYLTGLLSVRLGLERAMQLSLIGALVAIALILAARHFIPRPQLDRW
ncbi:MAG: MFS transporter [Bacillota bacterium]|nr:MFS transporter [Bacillota bacterium]